MSTESTIKFNYAPDGKVEINTGKTMFSDLFVLGAMQLTSKIDYSESKPYYEFATDSEGLKYLISKSESALDNLHNGIETLSFLLTDSASEEIQESVRELAWLIVGLAELSSLVARNNVEMNISLRTKKPD